MAELDGLMMRALSLPLEERRELYSTLKESIIPKQDGTQADWLDGLCKDVEEISGLSLRERKHRRGIVEARAAFVYYARDRRGIHLQALGDFLGYDHSTIHYYWKLAKDALCYPRQFEQFTKIYKTLIVWQTTN